MNMSIKVKAENALSLVSQKLKTNSLPLRSCCSIDASVGSDWSEAAGGIWRTDALPEKLDGIPPGQCLTNGIWRGERHRLMCSNDNNTRL